jgi:hypothetical protein
MPRISEAKVRARLAALGCSDYRLGMCGSTYELDAWAPKGFVWRATDCHTLVVSFYTDWAGARVAMMSDLQDGMKPCTTEDCEGCADPGSEEVA